MVAALQFGMWYYLGIEGTCQAAEEVRSAGRSIPLGTMCGMITLLIAAAMTWYIATGLMPWEYLGQAVTPLYDAARLTGSKGLQTLLFVGTLFSAVASANGCINDASRAWFSMSRDRYMPMWFGAVHPRYRTPYRSIIFLVPIAISFAFTGLLDQVITFSILSGLLGYTFMSINIVKFRRKWPLGSINRGYIHPFHPIPALVLLTLCIATYFRDLSWLRHVAAVDHGVLHHRLHLVHAASVQVCQARRSVHDGLAATEKLLTLCGRPSRTAGRGHPPRASRQRSVTSCISLASYWRRCSP